MRTTIYLMWVFSLLFCGCKVYNKVTDKTNKNSLVNQLEEIKNASSQIP